ncbi:MAG: ribosomal protection-like ABC-F family protein [Dethiobacteraceae bacterium]|jgi:ATP-binding cassette subfamily F protein 3|nr:ABC-F type ribosomal protection protein [Bacillota bacterium]
MQLHFSALTKSYQGKAVFQQLSGIIGEGDKIGLIGANGIGKTTLLKLLAGEEEADSGVVRYLPSAAKVLYLEQYPTYPAKTTVFEVLLSAAVEYQEKEDCQLLVQEALRQVGLTQEKWQQQALQLSGGEKTKLALARLLFSDFDMLILDEPTNHLDLHGQAWLEEYLQELTQPLLVISHNRYFLDRTVNTIWELTALGLEVYPGNYSAYCKQKAMAQKQLQREYEKQQQRIQHLQKVISEKKDWYGSAHRAAGQNDFYRSKAKKHARVLKAKEKELARIERDKVSKPQRTVSPAFEIINKKLLSHKMPPLLVEGNNISKRYGERSILSNLSFTIKRGDRIAVIGENGAGKTTLLRIISRLEAVEEGTVRVSPAVKIGYFAQELSNLKWEATVLDNVVTDEYTTAEVRLLLACLLFRGDDVFKKVAALSLGEKGRVAFAKLILSGANLLVLDELTNYMDIQTKEKVETVLADYQGSMIFVSHDRYFIEKLANRIFLLEKQKLQCYEGDYQYFLAKRRQQHTETKVGSNYQQVKDKIRCLEYEIALLSGQLAAAIDEQEKEQLEAKFLNCARELAVQKKLLES